jgi:hypothetical protein
MLTIVSPFKSYLRSVLYVYSELSLSKLLITLNYLFQLPGTGLSPSSTGLSLQQSSVAAALSQLGGYNVLALQQLLAQQQQQLSASELGVCCSWKGNARVAREILFVKGGQTPELKGEYCLCSSAFTSRQKLTWITKTTSLNNLRGSNLTLCP